MGQELSCSAARENDIFEAVAAGEMAEVVAVLENDPLAVHLATVYERLSPLHVAAANGRTEVGFWF